MNIADEHLRTRRRVHARLEEYPHPIRWKRVFDEFMYVVGILAPLALIPQVIQVWSGDASGVSLFTWAMLGVATSFWLAYGIIHKEKPIIVTNCLALVLNFSVVAGVLSH